MDASVYYIQDDYAGDPRQFYFGAKRQHPIQTQSTFNQKSYAKLVEGEQEQLMDVRDRERLLKQQGVPLTAVGDSVADTTPTRMPVP